jgi:REP element-mobilizing transposase RayT
MAEPAVILSAEQREIVDATIRRHCDIRGWELHAVNVRTNHVHLVVTGNRGADEMMNELKAWCSRKLSDHAGLTKAVARKAGRRHWFTEHGSTKPIFDDAYLQNAIQYVLEAQ